MKKSYICYTILGLVLSSCVSSELQDIASKSKIEFYTNTDTLVRNSAIQEIKFLENAGVNAYKVISNNDYQVELKAFDNALLLPNATTGFYEFEQARYWDTQALKYDFYAYSPYDPDNVKIYPEKDATFLQINHFIVNEEANRDLLASHLENVFPSSSCLLDFRHILSKITFCATLDSTKEYSVMLNQAQISLQMCDQATLKYDFKEKTLDLGEYDLSNRSFKLAHSLSVHQKDSIYPLKGIQDLLFIPQEINSISVKFTFDRGQGEEVIEKNIDPDEWLSGVQYEYIFTIMQNKSDADAKECNSDFGQNQDDSDYISFEACYTEWSEDCESRYFKI